MINQFGNYSLIIALITSVYLIYKSFFSFKRFETNLNSRIFSAISIQFIMIVISFSSLTYAFLVSDFSNQTVFNNSHTTIPSFYKFSGTWGNHEGSLLLWLSVLIIFLLIFVLRSSKQNISYRLLTILFQEIIILGFLLFILFTSNPFVYLIPIPNEGQGLNPILQDPALAIHPPILYLGYVGTSIIFSSALAALVTNNINSVWANHIKKWILISFIFLTIGILLGSIWAYYELGWGGFWFWDPVENVSLMPWFCLTALLHSIIVLEKRNQFHGWIVILSITTFALSMSGTFLVRSGILNSIHTFANDPSRGIFILCFLFLLIILSIFIYFIFQKNIPIQFFKNYFISKETAILINNWFMMFFLSVVLIGTVYPIFLETINGDKISIGPPFYHKLLIPFLIPFLLFMSIGPKLSWVKQKINKTNYKIISIFLFSILTAYIIFEKSSLSTLYSLPLFALSIYLMIVTIRDFMGKKSSINQKISHLGFSLLIFSILINGIYSKEFTSNMKVGDERKFLGKIIKFEDLQVFQSQNFKSLRAEFIIKDKNKIFNMKPEIRIYNQPETITSEADILTTFYSDNFLVFNILKTDGYFNVRYQFKPLMIWIWISVILISTGSIFSLLGRQK
tara:strand:+ start:145 stop:2016 length:1872 start_codon:yes stop_codon:yes gene_type:complete